MFHAVQDFILLWEDQNGLWSYQTDSNLRGSCVFPFSFHSLISSHFQFIKAKVYVYSSDIRVSSEEFTLITPRYWKSILHRLIFLGRKYAAHFLQLKPFMQYQFISFHLVPITAVWPQAVWIQSLPKACTHSQRRQNRTQTPWYLVQRISYSVSPNTNAILSTWHVSP